MKSATFIRNLHMVLLLNGVLAYSSCAIFKPSAKTAFVDGIYKQTTGNTSQKVYVDIISDSLNIYPLNDDSKPAATAPDQVLPYEIHTTAAVQSSFSKSSLDIDFISIPLKYRFTRLSVPPQLNANLNGALYLGYRTDQYNVSYQNNPLQRSLRNITHFGFSVGLYTGLGNTAITATNTGKRTDQEYDALVWTKGISGIIGLNNFTVGLTLGFDNLLDRNRGIWLYESQPYIGFAIGLNLN